MDLEWKERERKIKQIIAWNILGNNFWCWDDVQKGKEMAGLIGRSTFTIFFPWISGRLLLLYRLLLKNLSLFFFFFLTWHIFRSLVTRINISCVLNLRKCNHLSHLPFLKINHEGCQSHVCPSKRESCFCNFYIKIVQIVERQGASI